MATLARIHIHPFKSLDPQSVDQAVVLPGGALEHDRRFALADVHGDFIHGKRTPSIHLLRSHFDPATRRLSLRIDGTAAEHAFEVDQQRGPLQDWLANYFDTPVTILENADAGFPDDTEASGPTVISTATLAEVAGWFPGVSTEEARARFRANLEISGVEPFWEDRLVAEGLGVVRFQIGDVEFLGTNPCARCIVPTRNSRTGQPIHGFAKMFARGRETSLPPWAAADRFDHFYRLSVNTRRAEVRPAVLRVGDEVRILGIA